MRQDAGGKDNDEEACQRAAENEANDGGRQEQGLHTKHQKAQNPNADGRLMGPLKQSDMFKLHCGA